MTEQAPFLSRFPALARVRALPRHYQLAGIAGLIAIIVVLSLWLRGPDYRVLFSNLEDRDGGAIVSALSQMNIPYRFSENGSAILIPADKVHATRLQLAEQGLPRSGQVGFELFDNARFGASQFSEQVTYQRGLEGELGKSIEALHSVQSARVHLAIPRETLFVRERQAPTASVLLNLYPGRHLSQNQVSAIAWLVSSSVPNLSADNVSIVDQNGRLLTQPSGEARTDGLQRDMVRDIEQRTVERIMTLLTPLVGAENVRAQVSADIDFSQREQTSEVYRPNQTPGEAAIRSQQLSSSAQSGNTIAQGVPGALSNQPPATPTAPIEAPAQNADQAQAGNATGTGNASTNINTRNDSTTNYELDRTISHIKDPVGRIQRLSAAVVINYRRQDDGEFVPLADEDIAKIESIVQQAMGFNAERGDTISVVNSQFNDMVQTPPIWKDPDVHALASTILKYLLIAIALLVVWRKIIKPIVDTALQPRIQTTDEAVDPTTLEESKQAEQRLSAINRYEDNLNTARELAKKDPRAVAMVMRTWMEKNGTR